DDTDADWLYDSEENKMDTLPTNPDTDGGGVYDGAEVLYGTDPLNPVDDYPVFSGGGGVNAVGNNWLRDYVYSSTDYKEETVSENIIYISEMPADGFSYLHLKAEVLDEDSSIDMSDNSSVVKFSILDPGNGYAEVAYKNVSVVDGVAETDIMAKTVSGEAQVTATITPSALPAMDTTVDVYPGEVVSMEFKTQSTVMASGGVNKMDGILMLYDQYGNISNRSSNTITFNIEGGGQLGDIVDEDEATDGTQVTTFEGYIPFSIISSEEASTTTVTANYEEVSETLDIQILDGINLVVNPKDSILTANGASTTAFDVYANDADGNVLTGFNPIVSLSVTNDTYGALNSASEVQLVEGYGQGSFLASTVAGDAYVMASSLGIESGNALITLEPGSVHELKIESEDGNDLIMANGTKTVLVKTYDQYGNFAYNDSSTGISIRLTDLTQEYGSLSDETIYPEDGIARVTATAGDISGMLNIVATGTNLISGTKTLEVRSEITSDDISEMSPSVLYASLLGAPVGQVTYDDYFGGWFLFNGKTQAVISLLDYPEPHKRLMQLEANGKSTVIGGAFLIEKVTPSGDDSLPMKTVWQDDTSKITVAETLIVLDSDGNVNESEDLTAETEPGAYISLQTTDAIYEFKSKFSKINNSLSLLQDGNEVLRLTGKGQIKLFSANYTLEVNNGYASPAIDIFNNENLVATVLLIPSTSLNDVQLLDRDYDWGDWGTLSPGVYMKQYESNDYGFEISLSGNSSDEPIGYFLVDKNAVLTSDQAPSLGYSSLESAQNDGGMGFENDNKNILLFSAGNTAGESNKYGVSEIGVLLGDPTISLDNSYSSSSLGYTKDIGKILVSGDETIQDIVPLDYNNDGLQDLLVAYESGKIKLLQNSDSEDRFSDKGELLDIVNGILSLDHADFNQDGYDDLIIATEDSCINGEICVYLYENNEGKFERNNLDLDSASQVYQIEVADMNNDDWPDIVTSDNVGTIMVFYNEDGEINTEGYYVGNLGVKVSDDMDLASEVFLYYDDMTAANDSETTADETTADDSYFYTLPIPSSEGFDAVDEKFGDEGVSVSSAFEDLLTTSVGSLEIATEESQATDDVSFVMSTYDDSLYQTTKTGVDVNGDIAEPGDEIKYTISITNSSSTDIEDLYISDIVSSLMDIDLESFECGTYCGTEMEIIETDDAGRPFVIRGVPLYAGDTLEISYSAFVLSIPKVNITIGNNFDDYREDDYLDILASPAGNPSGQVIYFYSNGSYIKSGDSFVNMWSGLRVMNYTQMTSEAVDSVQASQDLTSSILADAGFDIDMTTDENDNKMPDDLEGGDDNKPSDALSKIANSQLGDADGDGLVDSWDSAVTTATDSIAKADAIAGQVAGVLEMFVCGGGCIASPLNIAFLSMGAFNFYGIPAGYFLGFPIVGATVNPPWVCTGPLCYSPVGIFRLYFDITTTLGTAMAVCVGPWPSTPPVGAGCWAFNLPILQLTGVCDKLNSAISLAMSSATAAITSGDSLIINSVPASSGVDSGASGGVGNYSLGNYLVSAFSGSKIQVPGFPAFFTEWLKKQGEELLNLVDMPDIYFIYPTNILGSFKKTTSLKELKTTTDLNGLSRVLTVINSLPIIQIKTEPVTFMIPSLSKEEFLKYKEQLKLWVPDAKDEFNRVASGWIANGFSAELDGVSELIANVESNIQVIDEYIEFPQKIAEYRTAEVDLVKQIICYLDAIVEFTGGYIKLNKERIDAWKKFYKDVVEAFDTWKALFQLAIDYQDSCDKCTSQRGSLIELLLKLFLFIPEPPVIELPKWPDIVIDISQIQAGVEISWPDITFQAEPLILPDIPSLTLPDLPTIDIGLTLPSIPVLPSPPDLPDIPDLPGIPIPDLPDIPPPPEVPNLDVALKITLKLLGNIFKIVCLVKQGLIPVPEGTLKTQIEDLTQRPLDVLFPFDLLLAFNTPSLSVDFVKRIEVIARMNLSIEATFIVDTVQSVADVANSATTMFTTTVNNVSSAITETTQDAIDETSEAVGDVTETNVEGEVDLSMQSEDLQSAVALLSQSLDDLNEQMIAYNDSLPDEISIVAEQAYLTDDDLSPYDEVAYKNYDDIYNLIADTPTDSLLDLKKQLVAYVENNESINDEISIDGWDGFQRLLVQNPDTGYLFADYNDGGNGWTNANEVADVLENGAPLTNEDLGEIEESFKTGLDNLLASASEDDSSTTSDIPVTTTVTKGLFIYNEVEEVNERLVNYTAEAGSTSKIVTFDMDNDDDEDLVYSYGGNIYLKENFINEPEELNYYEEVPRLASVDYFLPQITSVNSFVSGEHGNEEATMSFASNVDPILADDYIGYEVTYYDNRSAIDLEDEPIGIISLILGAEDKTVSFQDEAGTEYAAGSMLETDVETVLGNTAYNDLIFVPADAKFLMPSVAQGFAYISSVGGEGILKDSFLRTVVYKDGETTVSAGSIIHTLSDSEITVQLDADDPYTISLSGNTLFPIGNNLTDDLSLRVESGSIEIIDPSETNRQPEQALVQGMILYEDEWIESTSGETVVSLLLGGTATINEGQVYFYRNLIDNENPTQNIGLNNGDYYAQMYAIDSFGIHSTVSNTILLAPQLCADDSTPYTDVGTAEREIPIFTTLELDASGSFDSDSNIIKYYLDNDLESDSDGDGDSENDANSYSDGDGNLTNDWDNPVFTVGPYDEIGLHYVKIWVADEAGNLNSQLVTINVYVPDITVDSASAETGIVTGSTIPKSPDMPFILIRDRDGVVDQLTTPTSDENGKFYTVDDGTYEISDLDIESRILILNSDGETIAEFNPDTGQILITDDRYGVDVLPTDLEWPTRLIVYEIASGQIIYSIFLVTDANTDVSIGETEFTAESIQGLTGVHMRVLNENGFLINTIGASDPLFPGSVEITKDGERYALIASDGNIYILNSDFDLSLAAADSLDDPLVISLNYSGTTMAEIYIATNGSASEETTGNLGLPSLNDAMNAEIESQDSDGGGIDDATELIYGLNP
ncbi:MAG: FG-GAP-like repeat-containing protein, partial [Candidatus Gracilibacteria bacterium]